MKLKLILYLDYKLINMKRVNISVYLYNDVKGGDKETIPFPSDKDAI